MYASRRGGKHRQDMILTFNSNSILRGSGSDDVGTFQIRGNFDPQAKEASWTKKYVGGHSVFYRGYCDAMQKAIWGIWDIGEGTTGGFKIWLLGEGHLDGEVETEAKPVTVALGKLVPVGTTSIKSNDRFA